MGMQTNRLWFIFDLGLKVLALTTLQKKEFDSVIKLTQMGVFHTKDWRICKKKT